MATHISTWEEWGQVFDKLEFWQDEIEGICAQHSIEIQTLTPTFPGTHAVFEINHHFILKIFCPVRYNSAELERRIRLEMLPGCQFLASVLFHGQTLTGYDYMVFNKVTGKPLRELDTASLKSHSVSGLVKAILGWQSTTLRQSSTGELTCLVHYDLTCDHLFFDKARRLTAVIDFGDAEIRHPAAEFPVLWIDAFKGDERLVRQFWREYDTRCTFYQIRWEDAARELRAHPFHEILIQFLNSGMPWLNEKLTLEN